MRAMALLTPEATPAPESAASARTVAVSGATVQARPTEKSKSPRKVSAAPSQSTRACGPPRCRPGTAAAISIRVITTNGTLTAKISRQDTTSTR